MKIFSDKSVYFDHIIWQVNANCEKKCSDCYLHKMPHWEEFARPHQVYNNLIDILLSHQLRCRQFTINVSRALINKLVIDMICCLASLGHHRPHITLGIHDYQQYRDLAYNLWEEEVPLSMYVDSIAISRPVDLQTISRSTPEIILNHIAGRFLPQPLSQDQQVHLIIKKPALGDHPKRFVWEKARYQWTQSQLEMRQIPLRGDECILHYQQAPHLACHAGIYVAHIWPDGSVTGCPYDVFCRYGASSLEIPSLLDRFKHIERIGSPVKICKLWK